VCVFVCVRAGCVCVCLRTRARVCMCVFVALGLQHAKRMCAHLRSIRVYDIFPRYLIKVQLSEKSFEHKIVLLIFSTTFF
jgi:hypothetical protein